MTFNINDIKSPDFIKELKIEQLNSLCADIRSFILDNVSKTGGHLSSNLGSVEAIVAMHYFSVSYFTTVLPVSCFTVLSPLFYRSYIRNDRSCVFCLLCFPS